MIEKEIKNERKKRSQASMQTRPTTLNAAKPFLRSAAKIFSDMSNYFEREKKQIFCFILT